MAEAHGAPWTLVGNAVTEPVVRYALGSSMRVGCRSLCQVDPRASTDKNGHVAWLPQELPGSQADLRTQNFQASACFSGTSCLTHTTKQTSRSLPHALLRARSHLCFFMNNCGCFKCIWNWPGNYKALFLVHACYFPLNLQVRCPSTT